MDFKSVKMFLTELKIQIYELKNSFSLDFLVNDTPSLSKFQSTKVNRKPPILKNFFAKPTLASYRCNFCRCNSHSAFYCKKYAALKGRLQQCTAAKLCIVQVLHLIPSNILVKMVTAIHVGNPIVVNTWVPCILTWRSLK